MDLLLVCIISQETLKHCNFKSLLLVKRSLYPSCCSVLLCRQRGLSTPTLFLCERREHHAEQRILPPATFTAHPATEKFIFFIYFFYKIPLTSLQLSHFYLTTEDETHFLECPMNKNTNTLFISARRSH